ncbi:hypothetical protein E2C01_012232 [Portunus trituberculatus]|uniref:Uncharacterized protein n=1 Tax=Portunus trituberculatus TaxID=210409 RepID=A0A5B7DDL1_PORTR|nr:hypothetical protein [Portunus trituberculatus]
MPIEKALIITSVNEIDSSTSKATFPMPRTSSSPYRSDSVSRAKSVKRMVSTTLNTCEGDRACQEMLVSDL